MLFSGRSYVTHDGLKLNILLPQPCNTVPALIQKHASVMTKSSEADLPRAVLTLGRDSCHFYRHACLWRHSHWQRSMLLQAVLNGVSTVLIPSTPDTTITKTLLQEHLTAGPAVTEPTLNFLLDLKLETNSQQPPFSACGLKGKGALVCFEIGSYSPGCFLTP